MSRPAHDDRLERHAEMQRLAEKAWDTLLSGDPQSAIRQYEELEANANRDPFYHPAHLELGISHLMAGQPRKSLDSFLQDRSWHEDYPGKHVHWFVGVGYWYCGQFAEACSDWLYEVGRQQRREITHTDFGGGVVAPALLLWGSAHAGLERYRDAAFAELRRVSKTAMCKSSVWPGTVAPYLLGKRTHDDMWEASDSEHPLLKLRQGCLAHFCRATVALLEGAQDNARFHTEYAATNGYPLDPEFHLARFETGVAPDASAG